MTEAKRSQREISRFCIASLLAMTDLWVIGTKVFYYFSSKCGRLARVYVHCQRNEDIVTIIRFMPLVPGHIRSAVNSDELVFIGVVSQSVGVLTGMAAEWVVNVWAFFFGPTDIAIV